jgi:hypothetical protein
MFIWGQRNIGSGNTLIGNIPTKVKMYRSYGSMGGTQPTESVPGNATTNTNRGEMLENSKMSATLAKGMAEQLNPAMSKSFWEAYENAFPEGHAIMQQASEGVQAQLRGELPEDVADQIRTFSAEQGFSGVHAPTARNLGLATVDWYQQGQLNAAQLAQTAATTRMAPYMDMFSMAGQLNNAANAASLVNPMDVMRLNQQGEQFNASMQYQYAAMQAQQAQFQQQMAWERQVSQMNQQFERWSIQEQQRVAKDLMTQRQAAQQNQYNTFMQAFANAAGIYTR